MVWVAIVGIKPVGVEVVVTDVEVVEIGGSMVVIAPSAPVVVTEGTTVP